MWKQIISVIIVNSLFQSSNCNAFSTHLVSVIETHFHRGQASLYFCQKKDALMMLKKAANHFSNFNVEQLNLQSNLKALTFFSPQIVGVFLDVTCPEGSHFLQRNTNSFNSTYRWLIWTNSVENTVATLKPSRLMADSDVSLAYRNGSSIVLRDVYRMHATLPFVATEVREWAADGGKKTELDQPPLRVDLQGIQLKGSLLLIHIVINNTEEIPLLFDPLYLPGKDGNRRYCFTLFTHLAESYNFTYKYLYSDVWGYPQRDGNWSGMIGQATRREIDVGLSAVHYSVKRLQVIDFIGCLDMTRVCFSFLQPKLFGSYAALILPLDKSVWLCLLAITVSGIIVFRISSKYDLNANENDNDSWGDSFLLVMGVISQQGIPDSSNKLATKLIYLSLLFVSFLAVVHYNTSILNGLLLPAPNAIQNMDQLLASDLKVGTSDTKYLLYDVTQNDSLTVKLREKMVKSKFPNDAIFTIKDGVDLLKKGGFALYIMAKEAYPEMRNKFTAAETCSLSEIEKYRPFPTGGVVPNNSPYKELFNRKFVMMRERGIMSRGKALWNPQKPLCNWKQDALEIGIEPLFLAYLVIIIGVILSLMFLVLEIYYEKRLLKKSHLRKLSKIFISR